ncbi:MAG: Type 1 glutamine amidotransferase-like domain-containing protein, partial [Candidatus Sumerlaeota bacterium]|nr:Type 1 glutamine amidotransferase-like domain-containing protein [Candidatus Sumerlaeota bacterium]
AGTPYTRYRGAMYALDTPSLKPIHLLAGGGARGRATLDALLAAIYRDAGHDAPSIAYVGAATGDDPGFFERMAGLLLRAGARDVRLAPVANRSKAERILRSSDLIFVSGGDVEEGMRRLHETRLVSPLRHLHRDGTPFFGLSAGSIMLARKWVRWADPEDDSTAEEFDCLGLAPIFCDMHGEGDDWEELRALLRLQDDGAVGYGLPAATGLRVQPDGAVEALGGAVHRFIRRGGTIQRQPDLRPVA